MTPISKQLALFARDERNELIEIGQPIGMQREMFGYLRTGGPEPQKIIGSKSASDPRHTMEMFSLEQ